MTNGGTPSDGHILPRKLKGNTMKIELSDDDWKTLLTIIDEPKISKLMAKAFAENSGFQSRTVGISSDNVSVTITVYEKLLSGAKQLTEFNGLCISSVPSSELKKRPRIIGLISINMLERWKYAVTRLLALHNVGNLTFT